MKKSKFLLLGSVASLASIPFVAAKCGETKEEKKPEVDKPKLSETLKSITGNDLGKVQVAEQDKSNKEKIETAIKEAIVTKVPTLKDKELNLNADLSKKSVTVSAKGFEGEVTLKFEIETQSAENPSDEMNPGGENQTESDEEPEEEAEKAYREAAMEWVLETLEWVHRGEQGPTNFGIGWGQNHRWGKDDEQGKVDKLEQGTEANSGTKDQGTGANSGTKDQGTGANSGKKVQGTEANSGTKDQGTEANSGKKVQGTALK